MADDTDNDEQNADKAADDDQAGVESNADPEKDDASESAEANAGTDAGTDSQESSSQDGSSQENSSQESTAQGSNADGSDDAKIAAKSNVVPIDVFEPLGRYQSHLKVLTTCVTELADEAAGSIGGYLRRPVRLSMGDIRVIGQANCQPENSLLNGRRNFYHATQPDGYFYVGLSNELIGYLVELFYGGTVETLSTDAAAPGSLSEIRMRQTLAEYFSRALSLQLSVERKSGSESAAPAKMTSVGEQELIKKQFSRSMLSVMMTLQSDGLKCELETGFCINLLEKVLGVSFSSSEPVAISDARWSNELRKSVADCDLELRCTMAELPVRLGDVQKFKVGDFIPLADLDSVIFSINRRKLFQGQFGVVDDKPSASFKRWV